MKGETRDLLRHTVHSARKSLASTDVWHRCGSFLLVLLIALAPAIYAGVTPGGTVLIQVLAFVAAGCALAAAAPAHRLGILVLPLGAMGLLAALGAAQLIPQPLPLLTVLSPESARIWTDARSLIAAFGQAPLPLFRLSIAPGETVSATLLILAYALAFVAAFRLATTRPWRRALLAILLGSAVVWILVALTERTQEGRIRGPFVNPDHFAGWLEVSIPFALALVASRLHRLRESVDSVMRRPANRQFEFSLVGAGSAIFLWIFLTAGALLTYSRGAAIAIAVSTCFFLILYVTAGRLPSARGRSRRPRGLDAAGGVLVGLIFLAFTLGRHPLLRFLALDPREVGQDERVRIWQISVEAWKRFPIFGSGLGTFREAFRLVQPREFTSLVEQAHQDGLQLLVTGGVVSLILGLAVVLPMGIHLLRSWYSAPRTEERALGLAGLSALLSLLVHGLAEFNFSIPAVPVTLAAALGISAAAIRWTPGVDQGLPEQAVSSLRDLLGERRIEGDADSGRQPS